MEKCLACGAIVQGGQAGCQASWDEVSARAYSNLDYASIHDLAFDAYCLQHVDGFCRSAKSYAAHLTRLCCGLEYSARPQVYAAIQQWLNGAPMITKPTLLSFLGELTVMDVATVRDGEEFRKQARRWAECVWAAYAPQQELARAWIRAAQAARQR